MGAVICVLSRSCSYMYAFICVISRVYFHAYALTCGFSYEFSHMCNLISLCKSLALVFSRFLLTLFGIIFASLAGPIYCRWQSNIARSSSYWATWCKIVGQSPLGSSFGDVSET